MVRRRAGELLPLEVAILGAGVDGNRRGEPEFHGFAVAKAIQEQDDARRLTAHGTLYKALSRMQRDGLLESRWEDPDIGTAQGRPRRRLYHVTVAGARAANRAITERAARVLDPRPGAAAAS